MPGDEQVLRRNIVLRPGNWAEYDPFLMLSEDWFQVPGGFESHPHRGFETVTLVLEGAVQHRGGSRPRTQECSEAQSS
jgi:redox-sensitive bicupin YhaK (pirin superfamily)